MRQTRSELPVAEISDTARVAILIPCFNEAATIAAVVNAFKEQLPRASIFVYDNNSTDESVEEARKAGATLGCETRQGKGAVVRRMFSDVEADVYLLVDGDLTYDAASAPMLVDTLWSWRLDMVNASRKSMVEKAYRPGHRFGNWLLTYLVQVIFGRRFNDMLSGYRVFSRRFVKSFPASSTGFEIETELTVHALDLALPAAEIETAYDARPEGSTSKLNSIRDGVRILIMVLRLLKAERPFQLFGALGTAALILALLTLAPIMIEYFETGLVSRLPTLVAASAAGIAGIISIFSGAVLDTVTHGRREAKRLAYLSQPGPNPHRA